MTIIDTHCHTSRYWYEDVEGLLHHMDRNEVAQAVLIQCMGAYDNTYQTQCVRQYPERLVSVVLIDAARDDASEALEREAEAGAVGLRLTPDARSPGADPLAVWRKAEALGLVVSCAGHRDGFAVDGFAELIEAVPDLPIIIEHLGNINQPEGGTPPEALYRKVYGLARYPKVYIKIHGLGEFCRRNTPVLEPFPFEQPIPPLLDLAYEAFGPQRMMWGSDYPPVSGREGYRNALQWTMDRFANKPDAERALIFGGTAVQVFKLNK
mgnify:FL=1